MEEFRDITGYEGKYQVSNLGRVKSLKDKYGNYREKILKGSKNYKGYLIINLHKEGKMKTFNIHRLVAEAFIPNPHGFPCVNHKDEDKTNNNVKNLEWCDYKYNSNYGTCQQRRVENTDWKAIAAKIDYKAIAAKIDYKEVSRKRAEKQSKTVLQFTKDGEFVREWVSTNECGRNGFDQGNVAACCRGIKKLHKGFIWKYK